MDDQQPKKKQRRRSPTPQQQRFLEEYLVCLNATEAARRAGYSVRNANKIGPRLLRKPHIAKIINEVIEEESRRRRERDDAKYRREFLQILEDTRRKLRANN